MAKETITRCDGCDKPQGESDNFYRTVIAITNLGEPVRGESPTFDLCQECVNCVGDHAYPNEWPRRKRTRKDAAGG